MNDFVADDPFDTEEWRDLVHRFRADAVSKIADSALTVSLVPGGEGLESFDVKFALELGASIMLDKPIVALAIGDREVPPGLRRVAHAVIHVDDLDTDAGRLDLERKLAPIIERLVKK